MNDEVKIKRVSNSFNTYDYCLFDGNNAIDIIYGGNLDLYMSLRTKELIPYGEETNIEFNISKDNYQLYSLFDRLYNDVIEGEIFTDKDTDYKYNFKDKYFYKLLVNDDKTITWRSDDEPYDTADSVTIKKDEDSYKLIFTRVSSIEEDYFKNGYSISVRFRNSGSRYEPFNVNFMRMYQGIQSIDPDYHQVEVEEVLYHQKVLSMNK